MIKAHKIISITAFLMLWLNINTVSAKQFYAEALVGSSTVDLDLVNTTSLNLKIGVRF